ncbi:MAG: hypothetical protein HYX76_05030, partial [Acidobacteria bacterium]|nr:hypothetical protein [Acidobacteriota bacterium]
IRWSERLLVLDYPDEGGQHLEVTNFKSGFGALQLRPQPGVDVGQLSVAVFAGGDRVVEAGKPRTGDGYLLFVLPAGKYDVLVAQGGQSVWVADIDVPLDRTRLKQIAAPASRRP